MNLNRLTSERFQHSVCMSPASCTLCMINDRQHSSPGQYIIYVCLIHHSATEIALSCDYVLLLWCDTATVHARLCVSSASSKVFTVSLSYYSHCSVHLVFFACIA